MKHMGNDAENVKTPNIESPCREETDINTDGRNAYDWKSKYPEEARKEIRFDAIYITGVLIISLVGVTTSLCGVWSNLLGLRESARSSFQQMGIYFSSGLLGGIIFGIKYFYRVVARGYWTQDRRYWRLFSPWISACISLVVGCMIVSGYLNSTKEPSNAMSVCIGFIAGYFADEAVGKMSEVARALFGTANTKR